MIAELSLGDLITAAREVLDEQDQARGYLPEPGDAHPYDDAITDLVHRVAVNLSRFQHLPEPARILIAGELGMTNPGSAEHDGHVFCERNGCVIR